MRVAILFSLGLLLVGGIYLFNISSRDKYNIVELTDYSLKYDEPFLEAHLKPYYEFPSRYKEHSKDVSLEEIKLTLEETKPCLEEEDYKGDVESLREIIIDSLNIGFLLEGLDSRALEVTTISNKKRGGYSERKLLFKDENVGTFMVDLLIPDKKRDSYPAVMGFGGHGTTNEDFIDNMCGADLAREGFIVIIPSMRAMLDFKTDFDVSIYLMRNGFTLMGLRVYEYLLTLKYLRYLKEVDNSRIGLMAHSGGGAIANLLIYIESGFKVLLRDYSSNYMSNTFKELHCETIPSLYPFHMIIKSKDSAPLSIMETLYGFKVKKESIIEFFRKNF